MNEALLASLKNLPRIDLPGLGKRKKRPKRTSLKPGEFACPGKCRGGKHQLIADWVDCKFCKGGKFRCMTCKRGKASCGLCEGTGETFRVCDSCTGSGHVPDPRLLEVATCPWCRGTEKRACASCDVSGLVSVPCYGCFGSEHQSCTRCSGIGRTPCPRCKGRGRYGPKKANCDKCKRKGFLTCSVCDDGVRACQKCSVTRGAPRVCPHCKKAKEHPCNGCGVGAYLAWEHAAEKLALDGDVERAQSWLEAARARCEQRYAGALERLEELSNDDMRRVCREAVEGELEEELARIDGDLKALRTRD
ncbi:MAG: hypothetical protein GY711_08780 [bacterium]|nr:hypothetical protein [bacterium]